MRWPQHPAGRVALAAGAGLGAIAVLLGLMIAFSRVTGCEITTSGTAIDGCPLSDGTMAAAAVVAALALVAAVTMGPLLLLTLIVAGIISLARRRW